MFMIRRPTFFTIGQALKIFDGSIRHACSNSEAARLHAGRPGPEVQPQQDAPQAPPHGDRAVQAHLCEGPAV